MQKILSGLFLLLSLSAFSQETSVLFIGNSFTFMNNMPFIFRDIAESKGKKLYVDTVVEGGKDFNYHAGSAETYEKIKSRKWDYIIIQGHSNELAQPESIIDKSSLPFAKQIVDSIRANSACTQVVLYMTWGYKNGNSKWAAIATYESMQVRIKAQYLRFADLLDARISPVGEVWKSLRANYPGINLYHPDNIHPSLNGSYVSACTFFAAIYGESPLNNGAIIGIDHDTRQIIEYSVAQTVLNNYGQWRIVQKTNKLESGFDMFLKDKTLHIFDRSENAAWVEWDFGDGHVSTEKEPSHEYERAGHYTVTQRVNMYCRTMETAREVEVK